MHTEEDSTTIRVYPFSYGEGGGHLAADRLTREIQIVNLHLPEHGALPVLQEAVLKCVQFIRTGSQFKAYPDEALSDLCDGEDSE